MIYFGKNPNFEKNFEKNQKFPPKTYFFTGFELIMYLKLIFKYVELYTYLNGI